MCCDVWCDATAELMGTPGYLALEMLKVCVEDDAAGYGKEMTCESPSFLPAKMYTCMLPPSVCHPRLQVGLQRHPVQIVSCHGNLTIRRHLYEGQS